MEKVLRNHTNGKLEISEFQKSSSLFKYQNVSLNANALYYFLSGSLNVNTTKKKLQSQIHVIDRTGTEWYGN